MANYERDKDDVRVFDGGEDDEAEGSHLPVVIIIAILVLAAFGGVVWLAYNQGVARGRGEIPVQVAANEAGKPAGQIKVYQQPAGAEDEESVQTAPANPQTGEPAVKPAPAPAIVAPPPAPPVQTAAKPPVQVAQAVPPALAPVKPQPAKPQPAPQTATAATKPPAPLGLAHPAPPPAAVQKPLTIAKQVPAAVTPPPKPVVAVTPKPVETKPAAAGAYLLQIGAYKSQEEAMAAWKAYAGKHATLLKGFGPDVQRADLGDKGVWYRLRVSSFADKNAAAALCDRLKGENGACFLAR